MQHLGSRPQLPPAIPEQQQAAVCKARGQIDVMQARDDAGTVIGRTSEYSQCIELMLRVEQRGGAACHTGRRSCFFRRLEGEGWVDEGERVFDPEEVYGR